MTGAQRGGAFWGLPAEQARRAEQQQLVEWVRAGSGSGDGPVIAGA